MWYQFTELKGAISKKTVILLSFKKIPKDSDTETHYEITIKLMISHLLHGLFKLCPLYLLAQGQRASLTDHANDTCSASWVLSVCGVLS
jgi:hypothetical protein